MLTVKLNRGKFKIDPERAIKILKKKLLKERVLRELKERQFYVSKGRKAYLARTHREYVNAQASAADKKMY